MILIWNLLEVAALRTQDQKILLTADNMNPLPLHQGINQLRQLLADSLSLHVTTGLFGRFK